MLFITNPSHIRLLPFLKSFQFSKVDEESTKYSHEIILQRVELCLLLQLDLEPLDGFGRLLILSFELLDLLLRLPLESGEGGVQLGYLLRQVAVLRAHNQLVQCH